LDKKNILTLTTDLGIRDYYTAILKGEALKTAPDISIIDITHQIMDYNLSRAAFIFKNAYYHFPENTIHFVAVNSDRTDCPQFLVFRHRNHYFIGPDNGFFSLVFDEDPDLIFPVHYDKADKSPLKKVLQTGLKTRLEEKFSALGNPISKYQKKLAFHPVTGSALIRGSVIHIDNFDNVVVNIHHELFEYIRQGRNYEIYYKRWDPITSISEHYQDVPVGEVLARFNSSEYLEIAVNMGRASTLLGLETDDSIQIDFL